MLHAVELRPSPALRLIEDVFDRLRHSPWVANSGWLIFDRLVRAVLGLLVGAWVARYLGPSQYGLMAYVLAFTALFQAIANLGADAIVVRDIAQDSESAPDILGTILALRLAAGSMSWAVCVGTVALLNPESPYTIGLAAIVAGTLVFQASDTADLWFQSQTQSRRTVVAKLLAYAVATLLKVALILGQAPLLAFAAVTTAEAAICAAALFYAYRRYPTPRAWHFARERMRQLVAESWPLLLSGLSVMVYMRVDQIMVKQMLGEDALGIYAAALPLSQFWHILPVTLVTSMAPFVARHKTRDEASYRRLLVRIFRTFFYLGAVAVLLTWLVSDQLVRLLFGAAFAESAKVLDVHVASNVFVFLGVAHGLWLINERRFAVRLYGTLLAGAAGVAANWVLLPRIGVVGAAYSAIMAQVIATFMINIALDPQSFCMQLEAITFKRF